MPTSGFPERRGSAQRNDSELFIIPPVPHSQSPRLWGTFSASGGVGATTLTLHLARIATRFGKRVLVVESDIRAPLREILGAVPPFWEEYRRANALVNPEALPRNLRCGFALLTRRSNAPISEEIFSELSTVAGETFDLVLFDNPVHQLLNLNSAIIAENTLPSLIGINSLSSALRPKIVVINKSSTRLKKRSAIEGFITDAPIYVLPRTQDFNLALGFGVLRKLSQQNERRVDVIAREILH